MFKPSSQFNRKTPVPQLLDAFVQMVRPYLGLELSSTRISETDMLYVLGYAALEHNSLEHACLELKGAPSGNRVREVLHAGLPEAVSLQRRLNTILRRQLPRGLLKTRRRYALALDITLIPYHGQAQQDPAEVVIAGAKSGTKHFHAYATVAIVHDRKRYTLALRFVRQHERMVQIVRDLLARVKRLQIKVRRVYLDKEFYAVAVFRALDRRGLSYVVPMQARGKRKGVRALFQGQRSYRTRYTMHDKQQRPYTITVALVRRYRRGKHGRHGSDWLAFAVGQLSARCTPLAVFHLYRQRFAIESSYRQMHQLRARTCSRSPVLRLLLVGLALILLNLYISWRQRPPPTHGSGAKRLTLTLPRFARRLARAIERLMDLSFFSYDFPLYAFS